MEEIIEGLREKTKARLIKSLQESSSLLTVPLVSEFLSIPFKSLYRWTQPDAPWVPPIEDVQGINNFLDAVQQLRTSWPTWIKTWDEIPMTFKLAFFPKNILRCMVEPDLSLKERAEALTIRTLRIMARRLREERLKIRKEEEED
jgi:hypothetical protein